MAPPKLLGVTMGAGASTPGVSGGVQASVTWAALYSKADYHKLFDTKWDAIGVADAMRRTELANEAAGATMGNPAGFWNYDGSEEIYTPFAGQKDTWSVSILQHFHYNTSGRGAAMGQKDVAADKTYNTGVIMKKTDAHTIQSTSLGQ